MPRDRRRATLSSESQTLVASSVDGHASGCYEWPVVQLVVSGFLLLRFPPTTKVGSLWQRYSDFTPPVALLVPAYNEQATLVDNVRSLLSLHYPRFEIIVVNDGSTDGTLDTVVAAFGLRRVTRAYEQAVPHRHVRGVYRSPDYPNLLVVDKENGGKSDALNAAISISRCPLFCAVDADSLLETDALLRAVQPFVAEPARVMAVGGTVRIANGSRVRAGRVVQIGLPRSWLLRFQIIEYLRAFLLSRLALSRLNALTVVSGAFGIFRRRAAIEAGGYSDGVLTEDLEIVTKIHRLMLERQQDYVIQFVPRNRSVGPGARSLRVPVGSGFSGIAARSRRFPSHRCCSTLDAGGWVSSVRPDADRQ